MALSRASSSRGVTKYFCARAKDADVQCGLAFVAASRDEARPVVVFVIEEVDHGGYSMLVVLREVTFVGMALLLTVSDNIVAALGNPSHPETTVAQPSKEVRLRAKHSLVYLPFALVDPDGEVAVLAGLQQGCRPSSRRLLAARRGDVSAVARCHCLGAQ